MILYKRKLDHQKHCKIPFGTYIQALDDNPVTKKTQGPCKLDGVHLRACSNHQGKHDFLHLPTNRQMNRGVVHPARISNQVIKQVNNLRKIDGVPDGLKIQSRQNEVPCNIAWIAGVDCETQNEEGDQNKHENTNNEECDDDHIDCNTDDKDVADIWDEELDKDFYDELDKEKLAEIAENANFPGMDAEEEDHLDGLPELVQASDDDLSDDKDMDDEQEDKEEANKPEPDPDPGPESEPESESDEEITITEEEMFNANPTTDLRVTRRGKVH